MASEGIPWGVSDRVAQNQTPSKAYSIRAGTIKDRAFIIASATDKTGPEDELAAAMVNAIYFPAVHVPLVVALLVKGLDPLATVGCLALICSGWEGPDGDDGVEAGNGGQERGE